MKFSKLLTYHILFGLAVMMLSIGAGLLVFTTKGLYNYKIFLSLLVFSISSIFCYIALIKKSQAKIVFLLLFLASVSALRFAGQIFELAPGRYWPLYTIMAGLCMLLSNIFLCRKIGISVILISSTFILMGIFFSIFSFGYSPMRFRVFLVRWWPILFIASSLVLLILWILKRLVTRKLELNNIESTEKKEN